MTELFETVEVRVKDLLPNYINPRKITATQKRELEGTISQYGMIGIPVCTIHLKLLGGHRRCETYMLLGKGEQLISVRKAVRELTEAAEKEIMLIENKHNGEFDYEVIKDNFGEFVDKYDFREEVDALTAHLEAEEQASTEVPELPIVAKMSEKYSSFVIVCRNEIDENHIAEKLGVELMKCYKSSKVGNSHVVEAGKLIQAWK